MRNLYMLRMPLFRTTLAGTEGNVYNRKKRKGRKENMMPKDPVMLLSFVNLKLRDYYKNLDALCEDLDVDSKELQEKLKAINYEYDKERNQFV